MEKLKQDERDADDDHHNSSPSPVVNQRKWEEIKAKPFKTQTI